MARDQRKADARAKIQLGGIVIKAGAGDVAPYALLWLLVDEMSRLTDPVQQQQLRQRGCAFHEQTTAATTKQTQVDPAV